VLLWYVSALRHGGGEVIREGLGDT
jgi:hypothetical protein